MVIHRVTLQRTLTYQVDIESEEDDQASRDQAESEATFQVEEGDIEPVNPKAEVTHTEVKVLGDEEIGYQ